MKLRIFVFAIIALGFVVNGQVKKVVFNTSWYPQAQFAGYFVAAKKGLYAKRGIEVSFLYGNYEKATKENLASGEADLGIMWLHEGIMAHNEDKSIINIAQLIDTSNILIVAKEKEIKSIGVWKPYVKFLGNYIHKELSDSIEIVPLRNGNEAFIHGAVDAITVMDYNEFNQLINCGIDSKDLYVYRLSELELLLPEDGIYCRNEFFTENKKLCDDFIDASIEGWEYAFENIDEAVKICFEYMDKANYRSNVTIQKRMLSTIKEESLHGGISRKNPWLNKDSFEKVLEYMKRNGLIDAEISYEQFYKGKRE